MGIWYCAPIDNQKDIVFHDDVSVPSASLRHITLDKTEGKLGLLSLPDSVAFLYPLHRAQQINIAFDGCIYNRQELCHTLCLDEGDGSLIALLYEKYGPEGLYHLDGAFSLILVDMKKETTLLYRSFLTGYPLYYAATNNLLSVSTNPLDILRRQDISDSLDMKQMSGFFSLSLLAWTDSIFLDIDEVDYGEMVMISPEGVQSKNRPLSEVLIPQGYGSDSDIIKAYRNLVKSSVEKNILPDKKYGIMLSSGIDSSTLAVFASRYLKQQGRNMQAYSWSLPNFKTADETDKIKELCAALEIKLTLFNGENFAPFSRLDELQLIPDTPFVNLYYSMMSELYRIASEDGVNVLLNGHFGDGIFPSRHTLLYDILRDRRFEFFLPAVNSMMKDLGYLNTIKSLPAVRTLAQYLLPFKNRNRSAYNAPEWLSSEAKESRTAIWKKSKSESEQGYEQFSLALSKMNINSGIGRYTTGEFGLKRLEPYIDSALLNYTLRLPSYMAYRGGQKKYFAREAMRGFLPESIRTQTKYNVGNLGRFAYDSFMQNKNKARERLFDEPAPWKVYVNEGWMEARFKKNAEIKGQDIIVIWMSLHMAPWQRAIKPGGSLYKGQ